MIFYLFVKALFWIGSKSGPITENKALTYLAQQIGFYKIKVGNRYVKNIL